MQQTIPNRRGAVLIVALVLLAVLGIVAGTALPQILRDRQENRKALVRIQSQQLLDDALRSAEAKRQFDSEFSGEELTLDSEHQPFSGTFQITTNYQDDRFNAKVEYRDEKGKILYTKRSPQP